MSTRVDTSLLPEIKEYGAVNVAACFNCGNCTAICPLTNDQHPFPRNNIRMLQLGMRDRLLQSTDPWLCYYCGECSATCPREAEPAETMMAVRRWLTAQYDWTGLARRFYTSERWAIGSMMLLALAVVLAFVFFHGPIVTDRVELNTFAPVEVIHMADAIMAGTLTFFVFTNVLHMYISVMRQGVGIKIPFSLYVSEAWRLLFHAATQSRWISCDEKGLETQKRWAWVSHLLLVSGYVLMFTMVVFFLRWFQTDEIYPLWHPQRWLGYYATIVLIFGAGKALWGRFRKDLQMHRFSQPSDWLFPLLLLTVTLTGIFQHAFRYWGWPLATYYTYVVHLAAVAPMLILEVPFGKWAHLYYRPLAIYFAAVKEKALELQDAPATAPIGAD